MSDLSSQMLHVPHVLPVHVLYSTVPLTVTVSPRCHRRAGVSYRSSTYSARRDFASSRACEQNASLNRDGPCNLCATSAHARCHARTTTFAPRLLDVEDKPSITARRRIERLLRSRVRACRKLRINFVVNKQLVCDFGTRCHVVHSESPTFAPRHL